MTYIPLRNHSSYSLLQSAISLPQLIARAEQYDLPALALTDTGHLFGALEFSLGCQKRGIHPLIGCQLSLIDIEEAYSLALYAQNLQGYRNLCRLVSLSTVKQPPQLRSHISFAQLQQHAQGLLCLTGGPQGPLDQRLEKGRCSIADQALAKLRALFPERLYIEISRHELAPPLVDGDPQIIEVDAPLSRLAIEKQLIQWAYDYSLPLIATNQALFLNPEDYEAHDALRCIALGRYLAEEDRPKSNPYTYFRSPEEMRALFQDLPEALTNTYHLMERCSFLLESSPPILPTFPCQRSEAEELDFQSQEGLEKRLITEVFPRIPPDQQETIRKQYEDRRAYECQMITHMGFAGYFLIVADFIQWAKNQGIPVGPGRGSGASSLVAWALSITDVDPIRFNLFFERFLNPERVSMPDFDIDFCQERRDEVIAYVRDKYGANHVAHIITFGSLQARAVLRDVGRVLQIPYGQVDKICKLVPHNPTHPLSLQDALRVEPQLTTLVQGDETIQRLIDISLKLEGLYRHASTHAAGVIISRDPLQDCVPLYQDEGALLPATEFSMKYVESAGLIKFDFLGLKTLSVLQTAVNLVAQKGISLSLTHLPLDDHQTFELLRRAETVGIFQLEGSGMTEVLRQLQPEQFEEIIALVALYRPGPMDSIPRYIACRHGREEVAYDYPCLQGILKDTFGIMVYQEQVLQIAQVLAGYSLGNADLLRRAMGKKIPSEMATQRKIFIEGTLARQGGSEEKASQFFDQIAKFAGYAFPKAHAVPYALISYQTAYMKANHPVEFMTSLMIHDAHNTDKLRIFVREAKKMGILVLPPDMNASDPSFSVEKGQSIRYGLAAIKGVGLGIMEKVIQDRTEKGPFQDIFDFAQRTMPLGINKKQLESLITAGAFDQLHPGQKSQLMASIELILRHGSSPVQENLLFHFKELPPSLKESESWSPYEALERERQALGFYLTAHPLDSYIHSSFVLWEDLEKMSLAKDQPLPMIGMVMEVTEKVSKAGQKYAFIQLSDPSGSYEVTVFSDLLAQKRPLLTIGTPLFLKVQGRSEGDVIRLLAQDIASLDQYSYEETLELTISTPQQLEALHTCLASSPKGATRIRVILKLSGQRAVISWPRSYRLSPEARSSLMALSG